MGLNSGGSGACGVARVTTLARGIRAFPSWKCSHDRPELAEEARRASHSGVDEPDDNDRAQADDDLIASFLGAQARGARGPTRVELAADLGVPVEARQAPAAAVEVRLHEPCGAC